MSTCQLPYPQVPLVWLTLSFCRGCCCPCRAAKFPEEVRRITGFCPQFDGRLRRVERCAVRWLTGAAALHEYLTAEETLEFYGECINTAGSVGTFFVRMLTVPPQDAFEASRSTTSRPW